MRQRMIRTVRNQAGLAIRLVWRYSHTKGYLVVYGDVPGQGMIYLGDTVTA